MSELKLTVENIIEAPAETVFDAWLDPIMLTKFVLPMPGMEPPHVENDPRVGGNFSIMMNVGNEKIPHTGTYITIERATKLVFSWVSPFSADGSTVSIDFEIVNTNQTKVTLTHVKFIDEERRSNHKNGWTNILNALNARLL